MLPTVSKLNAPFESPKSNGSGRSFAAKPLLGLLKYLIGAFFVGGAISLAALRLGAPEQAARLAAPMAMVVLAAIAGALLRLHKVRASVNVLTCGAWIGVTTASLFTDGLRSPSVIAYPLIILACGWLIGSRAALTVAALTVAATLGLTAAEAYGLLPEPLPSSSLIRAGDQVFIYVLSSALIVFLLRVYRNRLGELRRLGRDLTLRTVALEESEERYRTMIEWTPEAIAVYRHGRLLYVNPAAIKMIGASGADQLIGKPILDFVHPAFHPLMRSRNGLRHSVGDSGPLIEQRMVKLDGCEIDVEVRAAAIVYDERPAFQVAMRDVTARKKAEHEIIVLAFYDTLTELPNRRLLLDRLRQAAIASARSRSYGALLMIDLDDFKTLNETLGHAVGDQLLQHVARRLAACVKAGDTVARLGGDEFVVMLENLGPDLQCAAAEAEIVGARLRASLNQAYQLGHSSHRSTASIGVALFPDARGSSSELLKHAELALYHAKAGGRDTLRFFEPEMQAALSARSALESDLHEALERQQFVLHYQPQVAGDGRLTGAEALLRWRHPQRGLVAPSEFIPLAEQTGLILPLGNWVLETACAQLARWADQPRLADLTLAVNVSARQFHDRNFVEHVLAALEHSGARPDRLKLELTESLLVANVVDVIAKMSALKAQGLGLSLDDFGTGYSSLAYLKRLPLDQLKIDQSFVRQILSDSNDAAIAQMIVALSQSLGLAVIAEGVETEAQRTLLAELGCYAYQGYLFSRPLPLDEFELFGRPADDLPLRAQ